LAVSKEAKMGLTTAGRKRPEITGGKIKTIISPGIHQFGK